MDTPPVLILDTTLVRHAGNDALPSILLQTQGISNTAPQKKPHDKWFMGL
jgi:hypothetical protein